MPSVNFQSRWAPAVEYGALLANGHTFRAQKFLSTYDPDLFPPKRTTIRRAGKAEPGQWLYLFTGLRTKRCQRLGNVLCLAVTPVRFTEARNIFLSNYLLLADDAELFARTDTAGQWGAAELIAFVEQHYGLPFDGALYSW